MTAEQAVITTLVILPLFPMLIGFLLGFSCMQDHL